MATTSPIIWWVRRDLRLSDNPALAAAADRERPVIPVFVHDETVEALAAAPKWRLGLGVERLGKRLAQLGLRLTCRRGPALRTLTALVEETGACGVVWNRAYEPEAIARDTAVKAALKKRGVRAASFGGHLLFEPWTVETKTGGFYKVYTPFWRAVKDRGVDAPAPEPAGLVCPRTWPRSEAPADWRMGAAMRRGAGVVAGHVRVGEAVAADRLETFLADRLADYATDRDRPDRPGTSGLSENLAWGEIGPRHVWHAALRARHEGNPGAEAFLKELVWREFAYHLLYHTPRIACANWRAEWDAFPWNEDAERPEVLAWKQGRTGVAFVDAAMRQMHVTGTMHNRGRMIVASYLTKHLITHWKIGLDWFAEHLIDWDPAANAMGWQWSAGSGPDATPYFRVFNPETQLKKFDPDQAYVDAWIAEGRRRPPATALAYFDAIPKRWGLSPHDAYPDMVVTPAEGRKRALAAYESRDF
ncbi:deoxyribodipyrimidine photo-lyase [Rhodovulum iodosum]|uniref:Deoxyribodipyrimidine photo-lyase n=1 Tax=Rhodovulum iodosum TaxID=68291 RepID=A0ABV3XT85_9RHOB|nr:deoxyribodipyrimidine photo-lyase [Rhodovulum robiginosum]RSK32009.1 deoxyribodipyrimidine photo-lyase [Rhodovulum robiginosum]